MQEGFDALKDVPQTLELKAFTACVAGRPAFSLALESSSAETQNVRPRQDLSKGARSCRSYLFFSPPPKNVESMGSSARMGLPRC